MSKLEELMDRREADAKAAEAKRLKAEEEREKKEARQHRLFVRKEFNRLFKRLKTLVEGHWDRYGWGWKFQYKGEDYWISYDSWFSAKTPGDVDDYDMRGTHWVLKRHFNLSDGDRGAYAMGDGHDKKSLTEEVLHGLKVLKERGGCVNDRNW